MVVAMPRRSILSASDRVNLLAMPTTQDELIRHYTFSDSDLALIRKRRGDSNRLGFALQLAYMRYPGIVLSTNEPPFPPLLRLVARQLNIAAKLWDDYGRREQTRREHLVELQTVFGFQPFTMRHYRPAVYGLDELASQTDKAIVLAATLIENLRNQLILLPSINVIERICAEAVTRGNRRIYRTLTEPLLPVHREALDGLLNLHPNGKITVLGWLRQSPAAPNPKSMLEHIERLKRIEALMLPSAPDRRVHQNRLLKLAREGGQ
jgi:hypothetical protein